MSDEREAEEALLAAADQARCLTPPQASQRALSRLEHELAQDPHWRDDEAVTLQVDYARIGHPHAGLEVEVAVLRAQRAWVHVGDLVIVQDDSVPDWYAWVVWIAADKRALRVRYDSERTGPPLEEVDCAGERRRERPSDEDE